MIMGIGVDAIEIERFAAWHLFSRSQLRRIFSDTEIEYCLSVPAKSAERFAVRFAAREAFFKALCQAGIRVPFLTMCAQVRVEHSQQGAPVLLVDWSRLMADGQKQKSGCGVRDSTGDVIDGVPGSVVSGAFSGVNSEMREITVLLSLSHAQTVALAMVVLQRG